MSDTLQLIHALLSEHAGQPSSAGEAFKVADAALSERGAGDDYGRASAEFAYDDRVVRGSLIFMIGLLVIILLVVVDKYV